MNRSESIKELTAALVSFHAKAGKVRKDSKNPFFKSKYASLENILDAVQPILVECGLSLMQFPTNRHELTSLLSHISGEWIESTYEMIPTKNDPQALGSVITYQRRYAIGSILNLNIGDDDDGNEASKPQKKEDMQKELFQAIDNPILDDEYRAKALAWLDANPNQYAKALASVNNEIKKREVSK